MRWQLMRCCNMSRRPPVGSCCWRSSAAPPWHLAPDVFEWLYGRRIESFGSHQTSRPRWCVVRNPSDRYASCVAWDHAEHPRSKQYRTPPVDLAQELARGRFNVPWQGIDGATDLHGEELSHRQPQHWFVWDEHGDVQCDCVVSKSSTKSSPVIKMRTIMAGRFLFQKPLKPSIALISTSGTKREKALAYATIPSPSPHHRLLRCHRPCNTFHQRRSSLRIHAGLGSAIAQHGQVWRCAGSATRGGKIPHISSHHPLRATTSAWDETSAVGAARRSKSARCIGMPR